MEEGSAAILEVPRAKRLTLGQRLRGSMVIGPQRLQQLEQMLSQNNAPMDLRHWKLGSTKCSLLADLIASTSARLCAINIAAEGSSRLTAETIHVLLKALALAPTLTALDISGHKLGDDGVQVIHESLRQIPSLTYLNLARNAISATGLEHLVDVTAGGLIHLDLSANPLGSQGGLGLASVLSRSPTLTALKARSCSLGWDGVLAALGGLCRSMDSSVTIRTHIYWLDFALNTEESIHARDRTGFQSHSGGELRGSAFGLIAKGPLPLKSPQYAGVQSEIDNQTLADSIQTADLKKYSVLPAAAGSGPRRASGLPHRRSSGVWLKRAPTPITTRRQSTSRVVPNPAVSPGHVPRANQAVTASQAEAMASVLKACYHRGIIGLKGSLELLQLSLGLTERTLYLRRLSTMRLLELSGQNWSDEEMNCLIGLIESNRYLQTFDISENYLSATALLKLLRVCQAQSTCRKVLLHSNQQVDHCWFGEEVAAILGSNTSIRLLGISSQFLIPVRECLGLEPKVTELDFRDETLEEVDRVVITALMKFNARCKVLNGLSIDACVQEGCCDLSLSPDLEQFEIVFLAARLELTKATELNLSGVPLGLEAVHALGRVLAQTRTLKGLKLESCRLGLSLQHIVENLVECRSLEFLQLSWDDLYDDGARYLGLLLAKNSSLTALDVRGNHISAVGLGRIAEGLRVNSTLRSLNLRANTVRDDAQAIEEFGRTVRTHCALTELDLEGHSLSKGGFAAFVGALVGNKCIIKRLNLSGHEENGPPVVVAANNTYQLSLASSLAPTVADGEDGFFSSLNQLLRDVPALEALALERIGITAEAAVAVHKSLRNNTRLTLLDVAYNKLNPDGAKSLLRALSAHPALRALNISGNNICNYGAHRLAELVASSSRLTELSAADNNIDDEGVEPMITLLSQCQRDRSQAPDLDSGPGQSLIALRLEGNRLSQEKKQQLSALSNFPLSIDV